ncbi:MAG: hypothetical protein WC455_27735 [Dehalococcoidia bacterium]|jgi:hypothetical protein
MFKLNTKNYKPIKVDIDGKVYEVKKITNRVILQGLEISKKMMVEGIEMAEAYSLLVDFIQLYLPLDRDWIMDNLSPENCRMLMGNLQEEFSKAMEVPEPPLAPGPNSESLPK